jgi:4-amino-4-deoxy-L-arabinose transferase-like glycosyltransferase
MKNIFNVNDVNPQKKINILVFVLLGLLIYFPIFLHLCYLPIRIWDEARLAVSAYEMYKNHNYLIPYFDGQPDMWSTKPPLMLWLQVMCFKLFGVGELGVRLPSALAALFTALLLLLFSKKYLKDYTVGAIAALVLVTCNGYIEPHVARTGDYDTVLTMFTTAFCLIYFAFLITKNNRLLILFFGLVSLAVLTKSIQGLMLLPALFIFTLIERKILLILKNKYTYIGGFSFLIIALGYYFLREHYNQGYLQAVWVNELGGRFAQTLEGHQHPFSYYFYNLYSTRFTYWVWVLPVGIITGFLSKDEKQKKLSLYATIISTSYLLLISIAKTKLGWYDAPIFPFLSLLVAIAIYNIIQILTPKIERLIPNRTQFLPAITYLFVGCIFLYPYKNVISKIYFQQEYEWDAGVYPMSYYLQKNLKTHHSLDKTILCHDGYFAHLLFYKNIANEQGQYIGIQQYNSLSPNDKVIASQSMVKDSIEHNYITTVQHLDQGVNLYTIQNKK